MLSGLHADANTNCGDAAPHTDAHAHVDGDIYADTDRDTQTDANAYEYTHANCHGACANAAVHSRM
jgi:hypothetical protein